MTVSCDDPCDVPVERCKIHADYLMQVGITRVSFVARLDATIRPWGLEFAPADVHQAELRAASTLSQMAYIRGQCLQFLRLAIPWTETEAADFLGVTLSDYQGYEAETLDLPRNVWLTLSDYVAQLDSRYHYGSPPPTPPDNGQPRIIRVYPDFPTPSTQGFWTPPGGCIPC